MHQQLLLCAVGHLYVDLDANDFMPPESCVAHGHDIVDIQPYSARSPVCQADKLPTDDTLTVLLSTMPFWINIRF